MSNLSDLVLSAPAILFGLTIHEFSHGYVAWKLGDPTARSLGRLTLNPLAHLDPIGTLALFFFRFGWAKPVPIDPRFFRHPTRDMAISSLAGPGANLAAAAVSGVVLRVLLAVGAGEFFVRLGWFFVFFNLVLCFFNLIPIPPLDGSRLLLYFLPPRLASGYAMLERYGFLILIGVIVLGNLAGFNLLWLVMGPPIQLFGMLFGGPAFFHAVRV
ncbi:site-2 protease family protein [candidate division WOR-3 bacterium]|nr:site-2 protease family protein [candidate division WOR-3 bacterium]